MTCQQIIEQIIAQPGRPEPTPEIESHLYACSSCSRVYLEQQALWRQMDAWEAPDVSTGFDRRLFARIGRRAAEPWAAFDWLMRLFRPLQPAFATALACMLVVATVVVQKDRHQILPPDSALAIHAAEKDDPTQIEAALDDMKMLSDFEILPLAGEGKS